MLDLKHEYFSIIGEVCSDLGLDERVGEVAEGFAESLYNYGYYSRKPSCVAGASVFLACNKLDIKIPKRRIAIASNISELSLRRSCEDILRCSKDML